MHLTTDQEVPGLNPGGVTERGEVQFVLLFFFICSCLCIHRGVSTSYVAENMLNSFTVKFCIIFAAVEKKVGALAPFFVGCVWIYLSLSLIHI